MSEFNVDDVRELLTDLAHLLSLLLTEAPQGALQRGLLASRDPQTIEQLTALRDRCRALATILDNRD